LAATIIRLSFVIGRRLIGAPRRRIGIATAITTIIGSITVASVSADLLRGPRLKPRLEDRDLALGHTDVCIGGAIGHHTVTALTLRHRAILDTVYRASRDVLVSA